MAVDDRVRAILDGLIQAERDRRQGVVAEAIARITERFASKGALGHGHLPLLRDRAAAEEYELRARTWLSLARRVALESALAWTSSTAADVRRLLESQLVADFECLVELLRKAPSIRQKPVMGELDNAKDRVAAELRHELDLAVYAQDRTRIPIAEQLAAPRYAAVLASWQKSQTLLFQSPPDYSNAAKEAVSAVEQLARILTGDASDTLGSALKKLRAKGLIEAPLLKGIEELWVWASATPGVRHGSADTATAVESPTARYVVALAAAALGLLLAYDAG